MSDRAAPEPPDPATAAWLVEQITQGWGKVGKASPEGDEVAAGALQSTDLVDGSDPNQPDAPHTEPVHERLRRTAAGSHQPGTPVPPTGQTPPRRPRPDPRSGGRRPSGA